MIAVDFEGIFQGIQSARSLTVNEVMTFTILGPRLEFAAGPLSFGTGGVQTAVLSNTGTAVLHLHSVVPAHPDFRHTPTRPGTDGVT